MCFGILHLLRPSLGLRDQSTCYNCSPLASPPVTGRSPSKFFPVTAQFCAMLGRSIRRLFSQYTRSPPVAVTFVNLPLRGSNELVERVTCSVNNDNDLGYFLRSINGYMVQDMGSSEPAHHKFRNLKDGGEYKVLYKPIGNFINNDSLTMEDRANEGVVRQLVRKGHQAVRRVHTRIEVYRGCPKTLVTDFDGIVETETHIFVIEAKLRAKVSSCAYYNEFLSSR